jgi:hypothetical protein
VTSGGSRIARPALACAACAAALLLGPDAEAGVFLNETQGRVTHAAGYMGTGGEHVVNVCLDPGAMPASGDPAQATRNAIAEFNRFQATLGNVQSAAGQGVTPGALDYESILLHEMGHCLGLDHNVLGPSEVGCSVGGTCVNSPTLFFTQAAPGLNTAFDTNAGLDGARGTGDDLRVDDVNRHWYRAGVNNPFIEPPVADRTTYVQSGSLPAGDFFAEASANFSPCSQGTATSNTGAANSVPTTQDVMMPILCQNNVVRDLSPNDRTTFRLARAGLDGVAGTADDYTVRLNYQGTNQTGCEVRIRFPAGNGGFFCSTSLIPLGNGDESIGDFDPDSPAGEINLQRETNWFFNQTDTTGSGCIFRNGFETATSTCT